MAEALGQVKAELGPDAIILHTRSVRRGGLLGWGGRDLVEITASNEVRIASPGAARAARDGGKQRSVADSRPTPPEVSPIAAAADSATRTASPAEERTGPSPFGAIRAAELRRAADLPDDCSGAVGDADLRRELREIRAMLTKMHRDTRAALRPDVPPALAEVYSRLIGARVADELARELLADLAPVADDAEAVRGRLAERIAEWAPTCGPLSYDGGIGPRVVALVGPTGAGKTTTVAKLAAQARIRDGKRVGLITIDHFRIAAIEQLRTYAGILEVPLMHAATPAEMRSALESLRECELVLIDTAGRSPFDTARLADMRALLEAAAPHEVHLVLALTHDESAAMEAARGYGPLGFDRVVFTKLDEAVGFGVILGVLKRLNVRLSYLTNGQSVPHDLATPGPRAIADLVLNGAARASASPVEGRDGLAGGKELVA